jgi:hypothetical protein
MSARARKILKMTEIPKVMVASTSEVFLHIPTRQKEKPSSTVVNKRTRFSFPETKKVHYKPLPLKRSLGDYMKPRVSSKPYEAPKELLKDSNGLSYFVKKEIVEHRVYVVDN